MQKWTPENADFEPCLDPQVDPPKTRKTEPEMGQKRVPSAMAQHGPRKWGVREGCYTLDGHKSRMKAKKVLSQTSKKSKDFVVGHYY